MERQRSLVRIAFGLALAAGVWGASVAQAAPPTPVGAALARLRPPRGFRENPRKRADARRFFLVEMTRGTPVGSMAGRSFQDKKLEGGQEAYVTDLDVLVVTFRSPRDARAAYARLVPPNVAALALAKSVRDTTAANAANAKRYVGTKTTYSKKPPKMPPTGIVTEQAVPAGYNVAVVPAGDSCQVVLRHVVQRAATAIAPKAVPGRGWAIVEVHGLGKKIYHAETRESYEVVGASLVMIHLTHTAVPKLVGAPPRQALAPRVLQFPAPLFDQTRKAVLAAVASAAPKPPTPPTPPPGPALPTSFQLDCKHTLYSATKQTVRVPAGHGGLRVAGTVTDKVTRKPVAGAIVSVTINRKRFQTATDSRGRYDLALSLAGRPPRRQVTADFQITSPTRTVRLTWEAHGPRGGKATETHTYRVVGTVGIVRVQGRVVDSRGRGADRATVTITGGRAPGRVTCDRDGRFSARYVLDAARPGTMDVPGQITLRLPHSGGMPPVTPPVPPITPPAGATTLEVTCTLAPYTAAKQTLSVPAQRGGIRLIGTVTDAQTRAAIRGAAITVTRRGRTFTATTDARGKYELAMSLFGRPPQHVATCNFALVSPERTIRLTWQGEHGGARATEIETYRVPAGVAAIVVRGRVTDWRGQGVRGAVVTVTGGPRGERFVCGHDGRFTARYTVNAGVAGELATPGELVLRLPRPAGPGHGGGHLPPPPPTVLESTLVAECSLAGYATSRQTIRLTGHRGGLKLIGLVRDTQLHVPLSGAVVTVRSRGRVYTAQAGADGRYEVVISRFGRWAPRTQTADFNLASPSRVLPMIFRLTAGSRRAVDNAAFRIPTAASELLIRGRTVDDARRPVARVLVEVSGGVAPARVTSDSDGVFHLRYPVNSAGRAPWPVPQEVVLTLPRQVTPPPPVVPTHFAKLPPTWAATLKAARENLPAAIMARLESVTGAPGVFGYIEQGKPLPATTAKQLYLRIRTQFDDRTYVLGRKILGRLGAPTWAALELPEYYTAMARLYHAKYPDYPVAKTLGGVTKHFAGFTGLALGKTVPPADQPQTAEQALALQKAIELYLAQELALRHVLVTVGTKDVAVAFEQDVLDAHTLRARILATATAMAVFCPWARKVDVVLHEQGLPIGLAAVPVDAIYALIYGTKPLEAFLPACTVVVLPDLFALAPAHTVPHGRMGTSDFAYPPLTNTAPPPPPAALPLPAAPAGYRDPTAAGPIIADYTNVAAAVLAGNEDFCLTLCRAILHREPSAQELAGLAGYLDKGGARDTLIKHLFQTPGYLARKTTDADFIVDAYQAVLGRSPREAESKMLLAFLKGGGQAERGMMLATLLASTEYKALADKLRTNGPQKVDIPRASAPPDPLFVLYHACATKYNRLVALQRTTPTPAQTVLDQAMADYAAARDAYLAEAAKRNP